MRSLSRPFLRLAFAVAIPLFSASVAHAADADEAKPYPSCTREPTSNDISAAKGAFEAGEVSFQEADYDRAILYWEDAFRRDCTAVKLLTNLARAYELAGKKKSAVNSLSTFLERRPEAADRPSIEKRIAALKKQIEDEKKPAAAAVVPVAAAQPEPEPATSEPAAESGEEAEASSAGKPKWPIYMTGAGALALALGVPIWIDGQSKVDYYKGFCPQVGDVFQCNAGGGVDGNNNTAAQNQELGTQAVQQRSFGAVTTVVGGGVAVAGAIVWYLLWSREPAAESAQLVPIVTPNYSGFELSGSF